MTPFERGFIKAAVEAGLTEKQARSMQVQHQSYMPQNERREFSKAEEADVSRARGKVFPKIFTSDKDLITDHMNNPLIATLLGGGLGAAAGGIGGAALGDGFGAGGMGAGIGAGLGGLLGGLVGNRTSVANNDSLEESMHRLPPNARMRDHFADPVYQRNMDRALSQGNNAGLMGALMAGG